MKSSGGALIKSRKDILLAAINKNAKVVCESSLETGCLSDASIGLSWEATCLVPASGMPPFDGFALWLGSVDDALNIDALKERRISAIVNMASGSCDAEKRCVEAKDKKHCTQEELQLANTEFTDIWYRQSTGFADFMYLAIAADDNRSFPIWKSFDEVTSFLCTCRELGRPVLVHCMQGVNRSAAVCAAFLAREGASIEGGNRDGLGVLRAVDWISSRRSVLDNTHFLHQLVKYGSPEIAWEDVGYFSDGNEQASPLCTAVVTEVDGSSPHLKNASPHSCQETELDIWNEIHVSKTS